MVEFAKPARLILVSLAVISIVGTLMAMFFGEKFTTADSFQNDTYSRSAIGHRLFRDLLEEHEKETHTIESDEYYYGETPVFFIEPLVGDTDEEDRFTDQLNDAQLTILVLPKRKGIPDEDREFVERHNVLPTSDSLKVFEIAGGEGELVRVDELGAVIENTFGLAIPQIETPIQLISQLSENGEPLFETENGVLVARFYFDDTHMIVVSDPDVLANHAVTEPANARFVLGLIDALTESKTVEIDETFHGYRQRPSFLRLMTTFPFSIVTIHFLFLIGLILWSGLGRFGRSVREPSTLAFGPRALIENTVTLFEPEHAGYLGQKYVWGTVQSIARQINAPEHLGKRDLVTWLDELGKRRETSESIAELVLEIDRMAEDLRFWNVKDVMLIVESVNRWKWEILNER